MLWLKYTKSGRSLTRVQCSGRLSRKLARTGSRIGALVQICEWQFMHVFVGGMLANADSSTRGVAVAAVDADAADVVRVAELDRLLDERALVGVVT